MNNLTPVATTYWFVYDAGLDILHTGVTEPGQVTSTNAGVIDHGAGVLTRIDVHKAKLDTPIEPVGRNEERDVRPGFFVHSDEVVLVRKEDCEGKRHLYEAVQDRYQATRL